MNYYTVFVRQKTHSTTDQIHSSTTQPKTAREEENNQRIGLKKKQFYTNRVMIRRWLT